MRQHRRGPGDGGSAHLQDAGALQQALPQVLPHPPAGPPVLLLILVVLGHGGEDDSTPRCRLLRHRYPRPPPSCRPEPCHRFRRRRGGRGGAITGRKPERLRRGRCRKSCGRVEAGGRAAPQDRGSQVRPRPLTARGGSSGARVARARPLWGGRGSALPAAAAAAAAGGPFGRWRAGVGRRAIGDGRSSRPCPWPRVSALRLPRSPSAVKASNGVCDRQKRCVCVCVWRGGVPGESPPLPGSGPAGLRRRGRGRGAA